MRNRVLAILLLLCLSITQAQAATQVKVSAISHFSTENPAQTFNVKVVDDIMLGNYQLKAGDILDCNVLEVTDPKRGKQNAGIYVQPTGYISGGKITKINEEFIGKYSKTVLSKEEIKKMPKLKLVGKAAVTVGSFYIKGLSQGVSLAEGMVQNEDGNRLKSGVKKVYKDSPLSYVEKGSELSIEPGDDFYFVFKPETENEENAPNYSYTVPTE